MAKRPSKAELMAHLPCGEKVDHQGYRVPYTPEVVDAFFELFESGKYTLTDITSRPDMPRAQTVIRWRRDHKAFADRYNQARVLQADAMADHSLKLLTEVYEGTLEPHRAKVILDHMKWYMSRLNPEAWSDKFAIATNAISVLQVELIGTNNKPPLEQLQGRTYDNPSSQN